MTFLLTHWKIIVVCIIVASAFFAGYRTSTLMWEEKALRIERAASEKQHELETANQKLTSKLARKEKEIVHDTKVVYRTVYKYPESKCIDSLPFVSLWNQTALGTIDAYGEVR